METQDKTVRMMTETAVWFEQLLAVMTTLHQRLTPIPFRYKFRYQHNAALIENKAD